MLHGSETISSFFFEKHSYFLIRDYYFVVDFVALREEDEDKSYPDAFDLCCAE